MYYDPDFFVSFFFSNVEFTLIIVTFYEYFLNNLKNCVQCEMQYQKYATASSRSLNINNLKFYFN